MAIAQTNDQTKTVLITGATGGLGQAFVRKFSQTPGCRVALLVRNRQAGKDLARDIGGHIEVYDVDMSSRSSISAFCQDWTGQITALINNAGLQNHGPVAFSEDGFETTLAVNHLGVLDLTLGLLPWLDGGTVLGIGSGTHNPKDAGAVRFGFRGGIYTSAVDLAAGHTTAQTERQASMDRYATSKLASMAAQVELSRRIPRTRFLTLDPGLMPGTGLVGNAPLYAQLAWKYLLPLAIPFISGASTPKRSAKAGTWMIQDSSVRTGAIYDFSRQPAPEVWSKVLDPHFGAQVLDEALTLLGRDLGQTPSVLTA